MVEEIGFSENSREVQPAGIKIKIGNSNAKAESSSESSSEYELNKPSVRVDQNWAKVVQNQSQSLEEAKSFEFPVEDEAINAVRIGKDGAEGYFSAALDKDKDRQLGEMDIVGVILEEDCRQKTEVNELSCKGILQQKLSNCKVPNMVSVELLSPRNEEAQVVESFSGGEERFHLGNVDLVSSRALEDVQSMGLNEMVVELPKPFEPTKIKSSWEATVDALNNAHLATVESIDLHKLSGTLKESEGFFPELVTKNRKGDESEAVRDLALLEWNQTE
ncbi:hypothetical protein V6N11_036218 [Hibiscus sabdariffa]|uniref:Uncharacterized protein n=1 Tax=Hibiscus sabdariffa TaxID=183260 RepID=A0ABR2R9T9_9ROSI